MKYLGSITDNNDIVTKKYVDDANNTKQDSLVSGTNIKTINNESLLGSGNISISGGGGGGITFDDVYPVGSIYMSVVSTDPGTLFGGSWTRLTDTFLLAAGSTYSADDGTHTTATAGASTVKLTANEIPKHTHGSKTLTGSFRQRRYGTSGAGTATVFTASGIVSITGTSSTAAKINIGGTGQNGSYDLVEITATHEHSNVGGDGYHENMPPYLPVYMWKRVQ